MCVVYCMYPFACAPACVCERERRREREREGERERENVCVYVCVCVCVCVCGQTSAPGLKWLLICERQVPNDGCENSSKVRNIDIFIGNVVVG